MIDFLFSPWVTPRISLTPVQELLMGVEIIAALVLGFLIVLCIWRLTTGRWEL
jgi:hypothetical protein